MKSGPTLAAPTDRPRRWRAAIRPVATVVLPTPDDVPATTRRGPRRPTAASVLDALAGLDALVEGVLDLHHLGHGVGQVDHRPGGVAPGDHHVGPRRPVAQGGDHVVLGDPAVLHRVGDFVEDDQVVVAAGQLPGRHVPGVAALGHRLVEVGRLPGEAVAQGVPFDAEVLAQLALPGLPLVALDELHDHHPPAAGPGPAHDPERGRRLALAVAGVDEDDRRGSGHGRTVDRRSGLDYAPADQRGTPV